MGYQTNNFFSHLDYFQSKQNEIKVDKLISCKINLKKIQMTDQELFYAFIENSNCSYQYILSKEGFTWVV